MTIPAYCDEYAEHDKTLTSVALCLDERAVEWTEFPAPCRALIAAAVEGWLADLGMRA